MSWSLRETLWALALFGATLTGLGCPKGPNRRPLAPLELAASPEPRAEADFREASALAERGEREQAQQRFRAFIDAWPQDPLAPYARFELGKLELASGQPREALSWFEQVAKSGDGTISDRGRMFAAIARSRLGEHERAAADLKPYVGRTVDPRETSLMLEALAISQAGMGDLLSALDTTDRQLRGQLPESERKHVEARARTLLDRIEPTLALSRAYEILPRQGYAWPEVARRLLRRSHQRGDSQRVASIAEEMRAEDVELDDESAALVLRAERPTDADPTVVGAILPLSGRGREAGEAALQGLLLAAETPSPSGKSALRLVYRDDAGDPDKALAAFEDLVAVHRVVAVIGPMSTPSARAVAARARQQNVPLLLLNPDAGLTREGGPVFRLLGDPNEEALLLVKRAAKQGAKRLLVMHPQSPFGDIQLRAFESAAARENMSVVGAVSYPPTATNLVREAEAAAKQDADALVLADAAARIKLLAPALASAGLWSVARGGKPPDGRAVLYLVPSLGFDASLADSTRRYLQGALFAVPFDPGQASQFTDAYRDQFQAEPVLFSALAHDAFQLVRSALYEGAQTREQLGRGLSSLRASGTVMANTGFSETHGPKKPAHLETMLGEGFIILD